MRFTFVSPPSPIPVHFRIEVVAIGVAVPGGPVIVREAAGARALDVWERIEGEQLLGDGMEPACGDHVVRKLDAPRASGHGASERIVNPLQRAVRVQCAAEIAVAQRGTRHVEE
jgi:hypothetical protein